MSRLPQMIAFALDHHLTILSIADIIEYRKLQLVANEL